MTPHPAIFSILLPFVLLLDLRGQDAASVGSTEDQAAYREAASGASADLQQALEELSEVRATIAEEKPSVAHETNRIAAELREARRRSELATTRKDAVEYEFEKTEAELKSWREEKQYIESLLFDFRKTRDSVLSPARLEAERDPGAEDSLSARLDLVESALAILDHSGKAAVFPGSVVGNDGILTPGTFAEAGPVTWFLGEDGVASGLTGIGSNLHPELIRGTEDPAAIRDLIEGRRASPAFDPTLGAAMALTETKGSILSHIKDGGFWIYPILLLAAVALAAAVAKWFQLLRIRPFRPAVVQSIIDSLNRNDAEAAKQTLSSVRHPARRLLERGIVLADAEEKPTRDDLEEALFEQFLEAQAPLQRGLPPIAIVAATAPLLGLLGTVTGMIETFRLINLFGTGDAKSLASGISEALVTTEFGLIVAIPALILHALLSRKVQGIKSTMEMTSLAFLNGIELRTRPAGRKEATT